MRLVDDVELVASERKPELVLDQAAALQRLVHARLEEAHALAAVALGARESDGRMAQYRGGLVAVGGGHGDADARREQEVLVADLERPAQGVDQPVHERHDVAEIGDVDERDGEFVAAQPGEEVAVAQGELDARADLAQHLVAAGMVCRVVDLLELVDVETEHRDLRPVAGHALHGVVQALDECAAIGEPGERIVALEIAHLLLGLPALLAAHPGEGGGGSDANPEQSRVMAAMMPK